jgi:enoyl-CoA hydratase/carnithine racemase
MLEHRRKQGKHMSDTIELLETIGTNAALRHASPEELAHTLAQADASDALKAAVISGDSSLLSAELGHKPMRQPQTHGPSHEEEESDHGHGEDHPDQPPKPDQNEPLHDR